jgi:hypothetical protein
MKVESGALVWQFIPNLVGYRDYRAQLFGLTDDEDWSTMPVLYDVAE